MKKAPLLSLLALIIGMLMLPTHANAATSPPMFEITPAERDALTHINRLRASKGLPTLRFDARLMRAARWHARDMAVKNYFSHTDSFGRNPFTRMRAFKYPSSNTTRGENIAAGNPGGRATFIQWRRSPSHYRNMIKPQYRAIGLARYCEEGDHYGCYWVTDFGSRVSAIARTRLAS